MGSFWESPGGGSVSELDDIGDVNIASPVEGDMVYRDDSSEWVAVTGTKNDGDVPTIQADGSVAWESGSSAGGAWNQDVDDDLTTTDDITSGNGTWSINTTLQCAVTTFSQCRARTDTAMSAAAMSVVECELQVPASGFNASSEHMVVGFMFSQQTITNASLTNLVGGIRGDGQAYMEEDGVQGHAIKAYTVPSPGTWVTVRLMWNGNKFGSLWLDDVLQGELVVSNALEAGGFVHPIVKCYAEEAMTYKFRNLKAWSITPPT